MNKASSLAIATALALSALPALAHTGHNDTFNLLSGMAHPVGGLDHLLAMVAVGLWGAVLGQPAIWMLPVAFPLMMAMGVAGEMLKISHDKNSEERLGRWMTGMYDRALKRNEKIESALELMATKRVAKGKDDEVIERALPLPNRPRLTPDPAVNEKRDAAWDIARAAVDRKRSQVKILWEGMGWGMDTRAAAGTYFGLYNAGVEAMQYSPVKKEEVGAYDFLFGKKAQASADIFTVAYDYAMRS
jgi:hypothetical protein